MHSQRPAFLIPEFLRSDEARPIRILAEYLEPLGRFQKHQIQDTVVFFGSARVKSRHQAQTTVARLQAERPRRDTPALRERLRRARRALAWSHYYEDARQLARLLTAWSLSLGSQTHRFVVCSGGGLGIMEAANRGASEAGGKTIGLNIRLPQEQRSNRYVSEDLLFEFHYFFMRKFWFAYLAKAIVIFPGGFGTLDELFEMLTLAQTQKLGANPEVLLIGREYWDRILGFEPLVEWGAVGARDLKLLRRVETPEEAFEYLRRQLSRRHLKVPPRLRRSVELARTKG